MPRWENDGVSAEPDWPGKEHPTRRFPFPQFSLFLSPVSFGVVDLGRGAGAGPELVPDPVPAIAAHRPHTSGVAYWCVRHHSRFLYI